jgi:hypothetical protein
MTLIPKPPWLSILVKTVGIGTASINNEIETMIPDHMNKSLSCVTFTNKTADLATAVIMR